YSRFERQEGGNVRSRGRSFRRDQRRPSLGSDQTLSRFAASRDPRYQEQEAGFRFRQKALEAEGNGARPRGFDPVSAVAARRHRARTAASLLRLRFPAQEVAGRTAFGAGREVQRWQADRGERVRTEGTQD